MMNLRPKITNVAETARRHPRYIALGLVGLFLLNVIFFIFSLNKFPNSDRLLLTVFLLHFVWPIALIILVILRLRRGASTDETELRNRREVTLRYFAIGTLALLIVQVAFWRYTVQAGSYYRIDASLILVVPILVFSGLLVTITWYWIKYSNNKLSAYINRAPRHYLLSLTTFVVAVICYIAYSDIRDAVNAIALRYPGEERFLPPALASMLVVTQSAAWIGMFAAIGTAVLGYLRPSETGALVSERAKPGKVDGISDRVEAQKDKHAEETSPSFKSSDFERLISTVETNNIKLEGLLTKVPLLSRSSIVGEIVAERVGLIRGRLTGELKELTKRGNLNLTIGILTTIAAVSALFWGLIATQPPANETQAAGLLRHYLPRISFAVFIEVFSFFFLRLYKSSLEDIKYYHNELTNLDSRLLALEIAATAQPSEALTPILLGLLNTDRNFILKSGESTVEIQKVKTEQQYMRSLIDAISAKIPDLGTTKKGT